MRAGQGKNSPPAPPAKDPPAPHKEPLPPGALEFTYAEIGRAFHERLGPDEQRALNDALYSMVGDESPGQHLRGAALIRKVAAEVAGAAGQPPELLPTWAELCCAEPLGERVWPCLFSLTQFGLLGFRHFVHLLPYSDIPESYKPWCQQQAALIPAWDWADWFYNAKEDYLLFKAELDRLEAAGMQRGAVGAAEDHVRALRAARAQAAAEQAKKDAAKKPPTRRKAPRPRPSG